MDFNCPECLDQSQGSLRHASGSPQRNEKQMLGKQPGARPKPLSPPCQRGPFLYTAFWPFLIPPCPSSPFTSLFDFLSPSLPCSSPYFLSSPRPLLLSLRVTRPIWAVWWSWEHRSLSGELSGALLKIQRADYCSCQSH